MMWPVFPWSVTLLVIGATATIQPFTVSYDRYLIKVGMPMMMALALLILPFSITGNRIARIEGVLFFFCYTIYCVLAILMAGM